MASWTALVRLVGLKVATLSATAARTTASATCADRARRFWTPGSRGAPGRVVSTCSATAVAAACSMCGVTLAARDTMMPRPIPGKMRALFACPMVNVVQGAFRRASESYALFTELGRPIAARLPYVDAAQALSPAGQAAKAAEALASHDALSLPT